MTVVTLALPLTLEAQVQIDPQYKPQYAANITPKEGDLKNNRAAAGIIVLQLIAGSLIYLAGPAAILMIAIGGFLYITGRNDQNSLEAAKKTLVYAIAGLVIILISFAVVTNIINIVGVTGQSGNDAYSQATGLN